MKKTLEKQLAFLAVLAETGLVGKACKAIGISRQTAYNWRESDPGFDAAWLNAEKAGASVLEDVLIQRAIEGQEEVTSVDGVVAKVVKSFDNKLLLAAVRARNPNKWNLSPKPEEPNKNLLESLTPDQIAARLQNILDNANSRLEFRLAQEAAALRDQEVVDLV